MDRLRDPVFSIVAVLVIGVLCGWLMQGLTRRSWLAARLTGSRGDLVTFVLVGIAGAFGGFHAAMLSTASTIHVLAPFMAAAVASLLVLWAWRAAAA